MRIVLLHGWSRPVFYDVSCVRALLFDLRRPSAHAVLAKQGRSHEARGLLRDGQRGDIIIVVCVRHSHRSDTHTAVSGKKEAGVGAEAVHSNVVGIQAQAVSEEACP